MIALGSCTMKLNAAAEMLPLSSARWNNIHPFAPKEQVEGYTFMLEKLKQLNEITGFSGTSLQPNSELKENTRDLWLFVHILKV